MDFPGVGMVTADDEGEGEDISASFRRSERRKEWFDRALVTIAGTTR